MKFFIVSILLTLSCNQHHSVESTPDLWGGTPLLHGQLGYNNAVKLNYENGGLCTGVLIAKNLVLTAAHCGVGKVNVTFEIRTNETVQIQGEAFAHESYFDDFMKVKFWSAFDVAIIKLADPAPVPFEPALIASHESLVQPDTLVSIVGYGMNNIGTSGIRLQLKRKIMATFHSDIIPQFLYFAPNPIGGACFGDSGGPALVKPNNSLKPIVVGISSFTTGCSRGEFFYTSVLPYRTWIENKAKELGEDSTQISFSNHNHVEPINSILPLMQNPYEEKLIKCPNGNFLIQHYNHRTSSLKFKDETAVFGVLTGFKANDHFAIYREDTETKFDDWTFLAVDGSIRLTVIAFNESPLVNVNMQRLVNNERFENINLTCTVE